MPTATSKLRNATCARQERPVSTPITFAHVPSGCRQGSVRLALLLPILLILSLAGCRNSNHPTGKPAPTAKANDAQSKAGTPEGAERKQAEEEVLAIRPLVKAPDKDPGNPQTREAIDQLLESGAQLSYDDQQLVTSVVLPPEASGQLLEQVGQLGGLVRLQANGCSITDEQLAALKDLEELESLELADARIGAHGVTMIASFPRLKSLVLAGAAVRSEDLAPLGQLRRLERLDISWTKVDDPALDQLAELESLQVLDLRFTAVSDKKLEKLGQFPNLKTVFLEGTDVSDGAAERLEQANPELQVVR